LAEEGTKSTRDVGRGIPLKTDIHPRTGTLALDLLGTLCIISFLGGIESLLPRFLPHMVSFPLGINANLAVKEKAEIRTPQIFNNLARSLVDFFTSFTFGFIDSLP
jgi:hypothetical protein